MEDVPVGANDAKEEFESYAKISIIKRIVRTNAFSMLVLLVVLVGFFSILAPMRNDGFQTFFRVSTFLRILQDIAVPGFLTLGVGLLIVTGNIDLSAANVGSLTGMIISACVGWHDIHWLAAIAIGLCAAVVIGTVNAFLVNELKLAPFIVTMAMSSILSAVMQLVGTDATGSVQGVINYSHDILLLIGTYKIFGEIPAASVAVVVLFIIYGLALSKSKFGRILYLMGGNRAATYLAGINPRKTTYFLFINCSLLASLAGIVNVSRVKMGSVSALSAFQFTGITAAILGGISFGGGSGGLGGAFLGVVVINAFSMGMTTSGSSSYLSIVMTGVLLLVALAFDFFNTRAQKRRVGA